LALMLMLSALSAADYGKMWESWWDFCMGRVQYGGWNRKTIQSGRACMHNQHMCLNGMVLCLKHANSFLLLPLTKLCCTVL
jgi:hypothetical protein